MNLLISVLIIAMLLSLLIYIVHKKYSKHFKNKVYFDNKVSPINLKDTVYSYSDMFSCILPYEVDNVEQIYEEIIGLNFKYNGRFPPQSDDNCDVLSLIEFKLSDINKNVFLSKEDAIKYIGGK